VTPCPTILKAVNCEAAPVAAPREDDVVADPEELDEEELEDAEVEEEEAPLAVLVAFAALDGGVPGFSTEKV